VPARSRAEHVAERASYVTDGGKMRPMSARLDIVLAGADKREIPVDVALSTTGDGPNRVVVASVRDATARREAGLSREREYRFLAAMGDITSSFFSGGEIDETLRSVTECTTA
jgi:hypothetical protein